MTIKKVELAKASITASAILASSLIVSSSLKRLNPKVSVIPPDVIVQNAGMFAVVDSINFLPEDRVRLLEAIVSKVRTTLEPATTFDSGRSKIWAETETIGNSYRQGVMAELYPTEMGKNAKISVYLKPDGFGTFLLDARFKVSGEKTRILISREYLDVELSSDYHRARLSSSP